MLTPAHKLRLSHAINSVWLGTPYMAGQCIPGKQGGVDCVRFCYAVLEHLYFPDQPNEPLPRQAQDAAFHNVEVVKAVTRHFWRRFNWFSVNPKTAVMPGDLLAVRQKTEIEPEFPNPHHVMIVGPDRVRCYDAWPSVGVRMIGIGGVRASFDVLHIYRSGIIYAQPS